MATQSSDVTKTKLYEAGEKLEDISENLGERAGQMVQQMSGNVSEYYRNSRQFVQENPVKGVAAAVATGVVIGSLLTLALRPRAND